MSDLTTGSFWATLQQQASALSAHTPVLGPVLRSAVMDRASFSDALAHRLADCLRASVPQGLDLASLFSEVLAQQPAIVEAAQRDLDKLATINPACPSHLAGFMGFRGFLALQLY